MQARIELQKRSLKKTGRNEFSKYNYFELEDFLPTVQEIFNSVGLCGIISYASDRAVLTIIDTDPDGGCLEVTSPMAEANLKGATPIQNLGAVHTYLRRYLWVTAMELVEHDVVEESGNSDISTSLDLIKNATSLEELTAIYSNRVKGIKNKDLIQQLKQAATIKKGELNGQS
jgi:hypothetical protein